MERVHTICENPYNSKVFALESRQNYKTFFFKSDGECIVGEIRNDCFELMLFSTFERDTRISDIIRHCLWFMIHCLWSGKIFRNFEANVSEFL